MNTNYVFTKYGKNFNKVCTFAPCCVNVLTHASKITLSAIKVGLSGSG
jgi:hypothetical protein